MPSGDNTRVWFPAMLNTLKSRWNESMSWQQCSELCKDMTQYRKQIRKEKGIKPVIKWCQNCKDYHEMEPAPISIRSLLFALKKVKVIEEKKFKELEREWKRYSRVNKLDAYGKPKA